MGSMRQASVSSTADNNIKNGINLKIFELSQI
jgi:hypothetical protein